MSLFFELIGFFAVVSGIVLFMLLLKETGPRRW